MKTTAIFLMIVLTLSTYVSAQKSDTAFDKIKGALENFLGSIQKEDVEIHQRQKKSLQFCKLSIGKAQATLDSRTKDVNDIKAHIKSLVNEITEVTADRAHRQHQIDENSKTLERFKKERCDNNLNYIKSLREHKTSIDIMKLLRSDLVTYFDNLMKNPKEAQSLASGFIEKMTRFAHLFDDEHRAIFIQLVESIKSLTKTDRTDAETVGDLDKETNRYSQTRDKTDAEVGTGHVDNTRGELQKLQSPAVVAAREYVVQLRMKTLGMIDALIKHLNASRKKLSEDEMLANEHFADFQAQLIKENVYLNEKIVEDTKLLLSLNVQLKKSKVQLVSREQLREESEENLVALKKQCKEKDAYFKKELERVQVEANTSKNAIRIFNSLMAKVNKRMVSRVSANGKYSDKDINEKEVSDYQGGLNKNIDVNTKNRNEVAL